MIRIGKSTGSDLRLYHINVGALSNNRKFFCDLINIGRIEEEMGSDVRHCDVRAVLFCDQILCVPFSTLRLRRQMCGKAPPFRHCPKNKNRRLRLQEAYVPSSVGAACL